MYNVCNNKNSITSLISSFELLIPKKQSDGIRLTELTEMSWYEWFIMAMRRFSSTIILMTENDPNIRRPKNRVNSLIPVSSKLSRSTSPKMAQNNVCEVSHKLKEIRVNINRSVTLTFHYYL